MIRRIRILLCAVLLALTPLGTLASRAQRLHSRPPHRHPDLDRRMALGLSGAFRPAALGDLAARGVRAEGLVPVFPSKTFPESLHHRDGAYPHGTASSRTTLSIRRCPAALRSATARCSRTRAGGAASRSGSRPNGRDRSPRRCSGRDRMPKSPADRPDVLADLRARAAQRRAGRPVARVAEAARTRCGRRF